VALGLSVSAYSELQDPNDQLNSADAKMCMCPFLEPSTFGCEAPEYKAGQFVTSFKDLYPGLTFAANFRNGTFTIVAAAALGKKANDSNNSLQTNFDKDNTYTRNTSKHNKWLGSTNFVSSYSFLSVLIYDWANQTLSRAPNPKFSSDDVAALRKQFLDYAEGCKGNTLRSMNNGPYCVKEATSNIANNIKNAQPTGAFEPFTAVRNVVCTARYGLGDLSPSRNFKLELGEVYLTCSGGSNCNDTNLQFVGIALVKGVLKNPTNPTNGAK
jgi:hypothetical protein